MTEQQIYNGTRTVVLKAFELGGSTGKAVAGLAGFLWPTLKTDVWDRIQERVENLVDDKIEEYDYRKKKQELDGVYEIAYNNINANLTLERWNSMNDSFSQATAKLIPKDEKEHGIKMLGLAVQQGLLLASHLFDGRKLFKSSIEIPEKTIVDHLKRLNKIIETQCAKFTKELSDQRTWASPPMTNAPWRQYVEYHNFIMENVIEQRDLINTIIESDVELSPAYPIFRYYRGSRALSRPLPPIPLEINSITKKITHLEIGTSFNSVVSNKFAKICVSTINISFDGKPDLEFGYEDPPSAKNYVNYKKNNDPEILDLTKKDNRIVGVYIDSLKIIFITEDLVGHWYGDVKSSFGGGTLHRYPGSCLTNMYGPTVLTNHQGVDYNMVFTPVEESYYKGKGLILPLWSSYPGPNNSGTPSIDMDDDSLVVSVYGESPVRVDSGVVSNDNILTWSETAVPILEKIEGARNPSVHINYIKARNGENEILVGYTFGSDLGWGISMLRNSQAEMHDWSLLEDFELVEDAFGTWKKAKVRQVLHISLAGGGSPESFLIAAEILQVTQSKEGQKNIISRIMYISGMKKSGSMYTFQWSCEVPSHHVQNSIQGENPSLSVNRGGRFINVYQQCGSDKLFYDAGYVSNGQILSYVAQAIEFGEGRFPSVSINNKDEIVLIFQEIDGFKLFEAYAIWDRDIKWSKPIPFEFGRVPSVAMNENRVLQRHNSPQSNYYAEDYNVKWDSVAEYSSEDIKTIVDANNS